MIILRKSLAIYGVSITQLDWKTTWVVANGLLKTKYLGTKKNIVEVRFWVVSHLDLLWVVWKSPGLEKKNGGYTVSLSLCMSLRFVICHPLLVLWGLWSYVWLCLWCIYSKVASWWLDNLEMTLLKVYGWKNKWIAFIVYCVNCLFSGHRLKGYDVKHSGVATHFVSNEKVLPGKNQMST